MVSVAISSTTIPNPNTHVVKKISFDQAKRIYSTEIEFEVNKKWWSSTSSALFITPEFLHAWSFQNAYQNFLTEKERQQWLSEMLEYYQKWFSFRLFLVSSEYPNINVISLEHNSKVTNLVLINDKGIKANPVGIRSEEIEATGKNVYQCMNNIFFEHLSSEGEEIISQDTKWIRLWLVTPDYRAYFQYNFE